MRKYEDLASATLKISEEINPKIKEYIPKTAKEFIEKIEEVTNVPVKYISTGPDIEDTIER